MFKRLNIQTFLLINIIRLPVMLLAKGIKAIRSAVEGGWLMFIAAFVAIISANTGISPHYTAIVSSKFNGMSLLSIVNDILMTIFFLDVGIEIKKEITYGNLRTKEQIMLPCLAASGGFITPMLIYYLYNIINIGNLSGIAIPAATDIAFTMGVISLFSKAIPVSARIFVMTLAIADDIMAIIAITLFYNNGVNFAFISAAVAIVFLLLLFAHHFRYQAVSLYLFLGVLLWFFIEHSGIHATLSGVLLGLIIPQHSNQNKRENKKKSTDITNNITQISDFIPNKEKNNEPDLLSGIYQPDPDSPAMRIKHYFEKPITYFILPLFALMNSGVKIGGVSFSDVITNGVMGGIALGLMIGKPLGIFGVFLILMRFRFITMPAKATYKQMFAVSCFCGIGFTMSIFVSVLSFESGSIEFIMSKIGIILGSAGSIIIGSTILLLNKN